MSSTRYANEAALAPPPDTSWGKLLALVPPGSRVLDVGCAHGTFAAALRRVRGCHVTGIEKEPAYAADARGRCDELFVGDAADVVARELAGRQFDVVIAADVLEHMVSPADALATLRGVLAPGGALLASIPNVTHLSVIAAMAAGRFPRSREGLLDDTHLQFYGYADVLELFGRCGYAARLVDRVVLEPWRTEFHTELGTLPPAVVEYLERNPHATTYQFILRAVPEGWARPEDREPPAAPAQDRETPLGMRVAAELAEAERKIAAYHAAALARDEELKSLHGRLSEYHHALLDRTAEAVSRRSPARARLAARPALARAGELRVLYVADREDAPFRYRCQHGAAQLREAGALANVARLDDPELLGQLPSYSMVVLFRLPWSERVAEVVEVARRTGAAVAFDVDDLVFDAEAEEMMPFLPRLGAAEVAAYRRTFAELGRTLEAADFCVVTTETLARRARARGKPAIVHPNLLSHEHEALARVVAPLRRLLMRRPLVGYLSGSNTHDGDLQSVSEAVAEAMRRRPELSLLLAGHVEVPPRLAPLGPRILRVPYLDHRLYPWIMARCRAVLAPLEAVNDFTNGKSALKVFEAGVFGVPAVVSPTLPYAAAVEHGTSGFVASSAQDWIAAIEALADARTSRRMGEAARALALAEHSPGAWRGVLAHALLQRNGRAVGDAPPPRPLQRLPLRERWRLVRRSVRLARRLPAARTSVLLEGADAAVRLVASAPRRGAELLREEKVIGLVLADRERPLGALEPGPGTVVLTRGRGAGHTVACDHADPTLVTEPLDVRAPLELLVVEARARSVRSAHLQLFWREEGGEFGESRSVKVRLDVDGRWTTRVATLPERLAPGVRRTFRIDPLDAPGEVELGLVALLPDLPLDRPAPEAVRRGIAARFLSGRGLEIGALQNPLALPPAATVRYVDRLTMADARAHYPELEGQPLVDPSILADADRLAPIATATEDFVVCNHVLEHVRDPIGALNEWLRVLRPGGHLYVAVPDHDNPLDRGRPITPFEHLLLDRAAPSVERDRAHFDEWTGSVHRDLPPEARPARSAELQRQGYSIHHHVFDRALFERLLRHACLEGDAEVVELQENPQPDLVEYVAVLRKRGAPPRDVPVDVVIPVEGPPERLRRCAESVIRHATGDWRLVLVAGAGVDPAVRSELDRLARTDPRVLVLDASSRGDHPIARVNFALRDATGRDVFLLDGSPEVFEGVLDGMRSAREARPAAGILVPVSTGPALPQTSALLRERSREAGPPGWLAALLRTASPRERPELRDPHALRLWIRAEVLERVGRELGPGGRDLCRRARKAGYEVRLVDDVLVHPLEGSDPSASGGEAPPEPDASGRSDADGPLAAVDGLLAFHAPRLRPGAERAILFLLHASPWAVRPGGSELHVKDLLRALRLPRAVVAWPEGEALRAGEIRDGAVDAPRFHALPCGGEPGTPRSIAIELALRRAIELFGVGAVHVHHLLSWPLGVLRALADEDVPYVWTHHDYYAVCPNWNLYDYERHEPCACLPGGQGCLPAFSRATGYLAGADLAAERQRHGEAMARAVAGAAAHLFPSSAARAVFERHLGTGGPRRVVIEHGHDAHPTAARPPPGPALRVAFMGEIAYAMKGAERYLRLVELTRELPIEWHVFGDTRPFGFQERLEALGLGTRLVLHGRYDRDALPDLLRSHGVELCLILPNWDETFSYVLSEALIAGVPALTSARGALGQRIAAIGAGRAVESIEEAAGELRRLCADRAALEPWTERARAFRHRSVAASAEEHRALYAELGWLDPRPLQDRDAPALAALWALASASEARAAGRGPRGRRGA